jgi:AhpD family alkylhydroperoxidase
MQARLDYHKAAPDAVRALVALERFVQTSGLPKRLIHLIKLRASQINGCAYCVDMHVKEARQSGESEQRLHLLSVWRESPLYSDEERAVLAWTESLTKLSITHAPDEDFEPLRQFFSDEQIAKLSVAIATINVWNRMAVGFRAQHPIDAAQPQPAASPASH